MIEPREFPHGETTKINNASSFIDSNGNNNNRRERERERGFL